MPNQTSASDFTNYKKLSTNLASAQYSAKPNIRLANPVPPSLIAPVNLSSFLQTQMNPTKHYVATATLQKWHR